MKKPQTQKKVLKKAEIIKVISYLSKKIQKNSKNERDPIKVKKIEIDIKPISKQQKIKKLPKLQKKQLRKSKEQKKLGATKKNEKQKILKKQQVSKKNQKENCSQFYTQMFKEEIMVQWVQCDACNRWFQLEENQKCLVKQQKFYCKDILKVPCAQYQKMFPSKKFKSEKEELKYFLKTKQFDQMTVDKWIQCSKCNKWRLAASEKEFKKLAKKKTVVCTDLGQNCRKKEDKVDSEFIYLK